MKDDIKHKLDFYPLFRERSNRAMGLIKLLKKKYNVDVSDDRLKAICEDYENMSRIWRQILQRNPKLRGKDYNDGKILSQEKQMALEYESGFGELKDMVDKF